MKKLVLLVAFVVAVCAGGNVYAQSTVKKAEVKKELKATVKDEAKTAKDSKVAKKAACAEDKAKCTEAKAKTAEKKDVKATAKAEKGSKAKAAKETAK